MIIIITIILLLTFIFAGLTVEVIKDETSNDLKDEDKDKNGSVIE